MIEQSSSLKEGWEDGGAASIRDTASALNPVCNPGCSSLTV